MENMGPFQEAVSLAVEGFTDEQLTKFPAEWPPNLQGVAKALKDAGVPAGPKLVEQAKAVEAFRPVPVAVPVATPTAAPEAAEIPEGGKPSKTQVSDFAAQLGLGGDMGGLLTAFMLSGTMGQNMDMGGLIPVTPQIVGAYSPKRRDVAYWFMGLVEQRFNGDPMIAINADGSVNPTITMMHIQDREEGRKQPKGNTYRDEGGKGYKLINVGVDAQSIYDADPVAPGEALTRTSIGEGNIRWGKVPMEVRQAVYLAATQTGEMSADDERKLAWLRDHVSESTTVTDLGGEFPEAVNAFYEAQRMGNLPNLKIQLTRTARKPEIMPRRRRLGVGDSRTSEEEERPTTEGKGFRKSETTF